MFLISLTLALIGSLTSTGLMSKKIASQLSGKSQDDSSTISNAGQSDEELTRALTMLYNAILQLEKRVEALEPGGGPGSDGDQGDPDGDDDDSSGDPPTDDDGNGDSGGSDEDLSLGSFGAGDQSLEGWEFAGNGSHLISDDGLELTVSGVSDIWLGKNDTFRAFQTVGGEDFAARVDFLRLPSADPEMSGVHLSGPGGHFRVEYHFRNSVPKIFIVDLSGSRARTIVQAMVPADTEPWIDVQRVGTTYSIKWPGGERSFSSSSAITEVGVYAGLGSSANQGQRNTVTLRSFEAKMPEVGGPPTDDSPPDDPGSDDPPVDGGDSGIPKVDEIFEGFNARSSAYWQSLPGWGRQLPGMDWQRSLFEKK